MPQDARSLIDSPLTGVHWHANAPTAGSSSSSFFSLLTPITAAVDCSPPSTYTFLKLLTQTYTLSLQYATHYASCKQRTLASLGTFELR